MAFPASLILTVCPLCLKPREQGRQLKRIHWVSNIGTALKFLEGRKVSVQWFQQFHQCFEVFFSTVKYQQCPVIKKSRVGLRTHERWQLIKYLSVCIRRALYSEKQQIEHNSWLFKACVPLYIWAPWGRRLTLLWSLSHHVCLQSVYRGSPVS